MHAAFDGIDVVNEGVHVFRVPGLVLHGNVDNDLVLFAFKCNNGWIDEVLAFVQELDEFGDAAGIVELFASDSAVSVVFQSNDEALVQEGQLSHADLRLEGDACACFICLAIGLHRLGHNPAGQFYFMELALSLDDDLHPFGQSVDDRNTDAVQAAGNRVAVAAEFAACVEDCQYDFHGGLSCFVHASRDAAAVIGNGAAAVVIQDDFDVRAVACQRFVNTVVDDFVDQMMQAACRCGADVHARTHADRFQSFQYSYILGAVIALAVLFGVPVLNFMNVFSHTTLLHIKTQRPIMMHHCQQISYIFLIYSLCNYYTIF